MGEKGRWDERASHHRSGAGDEYRKFFVCILPPSIALMTRCPPAPLTTAMQVSKKETGEVGRTAAGEGDTSERRTAGRGHRGGEQTTDGYGEFFCPSSLAFYCFDDPLPLPLPPTARPSPSVTASLTTLPAAKGKHIFMV